MLPKISAKIAGLSAIVSSVIALINIFVISLYTENFQLFGSWLSDLGTGTYATIFNILLVVSAILLIPFGTYLFRQFGRKDHMRVIFLATAFFLVLVGIFDGNYQFHRPIAYIFFIFAAASLLIIGRNMRSKFGNITVILVFWTLVGIVFINPLIETIQTFTALAWLFAAGAYVFIGSLKTSFVEK